MRIASSSMNDTRKIVATTGSLRSADVSYFFMPMWFCVLWVKQEASTCWKHSKITCMSEVYYIKTFPYLALPSLKWGVRVSTPITRWNEWSQSVSVPLEYTSMEFVLAFVPCPLPCVYYRHLIFYRRFFIIVWESQQGLFSLYTIIGPIEYSPFILQTVSLQLFIVGRRTRMHRTWNTNPSAICCLKTCSRGSLGGSSCSRAIGEGKPVQSWTIVDCKTARGLGREQW